MKRRKVNAIEFCIISLTLREDYLTLSQLKESLCRISWRKTLRPGGQRLETTIAQKQLLPSNTSLPLFHPAYPLSSF
jgi:hypothetical protein